MQVDDVSWIWREEPDDFIFKIVLFANQITCDGHPSFIPPTVQNNSLRSTSYSCSSLNYFTGKLSNSSDFAYFSREISKKAAELQTDIDKGRRFAEKKPTGTVAEGYASDAIQGMILCADRIVVEGEEGS